MLGRAVEQSQVRNGRQGIRSRANERGGAPNVEGRETNEQVRAPLPLGFPLMVIK